MRSPTRLADAVIDTHQRVEPPPGSATDDVLDDLEHAAGVLMLLPASEWPATARPYCEDVRAALVARGVVAGRNPRQVPSPAQVAEARRTLALLDRLEPGQRGAVLLRSSTSPVTGRRLFSWGDVAQRLGCLMAQARALAVTGLDATVGALVMSSGGVGNRR